MMIMKSKLLNTYCYGQDVIGKSCNKFSFTLLWNWFVVILGVVPRVGQPFETETFLRSLRAICEKNVTTCQKIKRQQKFSQRGIKAQWWPIVECFQAVLTRRTIPYMYFDCLLKPIPQYATTCRDSWSKRHTSGLQDLQVFDRNMVVSSKTSSALCRRIDQVQVGWRAKTAWQNDSGTFSQSSWSVSVRA